jgi:MraZ protein
VIKFLSTTTNKVDKKGRVSVPALFRSNIGPEGFQGVIAYKSFKHPCIEGSDISFMEQLSERIYGDFGFFSDENEALATVLLGKSTQLSFDPEGRIHIPREFIEHADIKEQATFVGLGNKFQIWNPKAYEAHYETQLEIAKKEAKKLGPVARSLSLKEKDKG